MHGARPAVVKHIPGRRDARHLWFTEVKTPSVVHRGSDFVSLEIGLLHAQQCVVPQLACCTSSSSLASSLKERRTTSMVRRVSGFGAPPWGGPRWRAKSDEFDSQKCRFWRICVLPRRLDSCGEMLGGARE